MVETLKLEQPIHNTRRVAAKDIHLGNCKVEKGQDLLIVLAAANRDQQQFKNADQYNIERSNNGEHLTFGVGPHRCVAKHFSIHLACEALAFLFQKYKSVNLLTKDIEYEPLINARLPKNILSALTKLKTKKMREVSK